jgi:hypothetical protein
MNFQRAAEIQVVLEGIALPATRAELVQYAARQDAAAAAELERLPDRQYERLDDIGELLAPTAPVRTASVPVPRAESGDPPGGEDYLEAHPADTGRVRVDAPPDNPPQKAITKASETQKKQQEKQEQ